MIIGDGMKATASGVNILGQPRKVRGYILAPIPAFVDPNYSLAAAWVWGSAVVIFQMGRRYGAAIGKPKLAMKRACR